MPDVFEQFLQERETEQRRLAAPEETPDEPSYIFGNRRVLSRCDPPPSPERPVQHLDLFRQTMAAEIRAYMRTPDPDYMLLVPAPPGSGKTWAGVEFARWVHGQSGRRVLYAGPRRDFYMDIQQTAAAQAQAPDLWLEWLPRHKDEEDTGRHTCHWADEIGVWLEKGYESKEFCLRVCGADYMNNGCIYHRQKKRPHPLVYGHHMHVFLGHPLMSEFACVIGDELPLASVVREWTISPNQISLEMDYREPLAELLHQLRRMADEGIKLHGPDLIAALGGAEQVLSTLASFTVSASDLILAPRLPPGQGGKAYDAPVAYLPTFTGILAREAQAAAQGEPYPARIWLDSRGLTLLTRRQVSEELPRHLIWFDATGTAGIYQAIFQRNVRTIDASPRLAGRIFQVTDRANGKASLLAYNQGVEPERTGKVDQLRAQIEAIIQREDARRPAIISFMDLTEELGWTGAQVGHFYGNRGTNQFADCDLLIVAGTPLPPLYQIEKLAKALWPGRMRAFDTNWYAVERRFRYTDPDGQGWQYPVSQFGDPELNDLLWQFREAEIVQAAHRTRILFRDVPVYLLTNIPIDDLPPTGLLSIAEVMGAPEGVDVFRWQEVVAFAEGTCARQGYVTSADLAAGLEIDPRTARKYIGGLQASDGWIDAAVKQGPGRPPKAVRLRSE